MSTVKSAELCWGQRYMWLRYHQLPESARHEAHIVIRFPLADGMTLPRVRGALGYLVRRHEALRTTYHLDTEGEPRQRVHPPGALPLTVATTEQDGTPAPAEVVDALRTKSFDLATEWPLRLCVITTARAPKQLVVVLNHIAADAWTVDELEREINALGAGITTGRPVTLEPVRHQPLDLARHEASPAAAEGKDRSMAYWRDELARLPADTFAAVRRQDPAPQVRGATLTSPIALDASRRIATRSQVWPSLVHLTAYTAVLAAYTGSRTIAQLSFTSLRDSGPFAETLTCLFSPVLLRVDCADDPAFSVLLGRVAECLERSRKHAYVPYDEFVELVALESARRGRPVRIGAEVNIVSKPFRRSRARRTTFSWNPPPEEWAHHGTDSYFRIYEGKDSVAIGLNARSTVLDAGGMESVLRGYEAVVLAHDGPGIDLRISDVAEMLGWPARAQPAVMPGNRIARVDGDVVDLDRVAAVLDRHPAVRHTVASIVSTVSTGPTREPGGGLVANVIADRPVTPAQLRTHFLATMYDWDAVRCPDWFRIHDPRLAWEVSPATEGDGLSTTAATSAATDAEQALAAVVAKVNGLGEVRLSDSYPAAGGRVMRVPRVLELLAEQGWHGLTVYQLASARPLRNLAALLHGG